MKRDTSPRIFTYRGGLFFDFWRDVTEYENPFFDNELWRCEETKSFRIGFERKWFGRDSWYYDGNTFKNVTILGIDFCISYTYDARPKHKFEENPI